MPVHGAIGLLLFMGLLLALALYGLAASGQFPYEHRAAPLRSAVGRLVLFGSMSVAAACLVIGLASMPKATPWYAVVIGEDWFSLRRPFCCGRFLIARERPHIPSRLFRARCRVRDTADPLEWRVRYAMTVEKERLSEHAPFGRNVLRWFSWSPYLLLALAVLFWAGNHVVGRAVAGEAPPFGVSTVRWLVAAIVLWPLHGRTSIATGR